MKPQRVLLNIGGVAATDTVPQLATIHSPPNHELLPILIVPPAMTYSIDAKGHG